ncbi:hypothetical protein ACJRO7_033822 [Eucalyptus globulus]|uniref:F-box domain-containing protein n=1 Tax=Eucalyptus globulus TaxID=34317 RepID=A0ABD3JA28_EUCGL
MSSSASDDDYPKLPHDAVVQILKRLPVRSLLRFRCVCRSWRSTIDGPSFVDLYQKHVARDASNWHLACVEWCDPLPPSELLCFLLSGESLSMSQIEFPFAASSSLFGFVGSCNGLICVTQFAEDGYGRSMYLWNLFTRKHREVRRSRPEPEFLSKSSTHIVLGFGFDARSNDYKIVRILHHPYGHHPRFGEIYSLNTDSWRSLDCEVPAFCRYSSVVFFNGNLHWFAFKRRDVSENRNGCIVLFDVAGEVFDEMALPEEIQRGSEVYLAVFNDLLAVLNSVLAPERYSICSVWVMREYGVPKSWTKLYTFKASGLVAGFDGLTRNGELLMEINVGERVSWNPVTQQLTYLPLSMQCDLVTVVESLVSP